MGTKNIIFTFAFLVACCLSALGAASTIYIPWTAPRGAGSVTVTTNPASGTLTITGTSGQNLWTNNAGVFKAIPSTGFNELWLFFNNGGGANLDIYGQDDIIFHAEATNGTQFLFGLDAGLNFYGKTDDGEYGWHYVPSVGDGSTPFTWDTSVLHTSGDMFEFYNHHTNEIFSIDFSGKVEAKGGVVIAGGQSGGGLLSLSDTNGVGSTVKVYASTNSGSAVLYVTGSPASATVPIVNGAYAFPGAVTTNLVIPLVATLRITNGLIMAVTGP